MKVFFGTSKFTILVSELFDSVNEMEGATFGTIAAGEIWSAFFCGGTEVVVGAFSREFPIGVVGMK